MPPVPSSSAPATAACCPAPRLAPPPCSLPAGLALAFAPWEDHGNELRSSRRREQKHPTCKSAGSECPDRMRRALVRCHSSSSRLRRSTSAAASAACTRAQSRIHADAPTRQKAHATARSARAQRLPCAPFSCSHQSGACAPPLPLKAVGTKEQGQHWPCCFQRSECVPAQRVSGLGIGAHRDWAVRLVLIPLGLERLSRRDAAESDPSDWATAKNASPPTELPLPQLIADTSHVNAPSSCFPQTVSCAPPHPRTAVQRD